MNYYNKKKENKIVVEKNILGTVKKNVGKKKNEGKWNFVKINKEIRNWKKCVNFLASIFVDAICKIKNLASKFMDANSIIKLKKY